MTDKPSHSSRGLWLSLVPFVLIAAWLVFVALWRPEFPGSQSDYGSNLLIYFQMQKIPVIEWPKLYQGMLGSHLLAFVLSKIFGLTPPEGFGMACYAAVGVTVVSILAIGRMFGWIICLCVAGILACVILPHISWIIDYGYYAQAVGLGFYSLALYLKLRAIERGRAVSWVGLCLLAYGGFCYPDGLMWLAPVIAFPFPWPSDRRAILLAGAVGVGGAVLGVAIIRIQQLYMYWSDGLVGWVLLFQSVAILLAIAAGDQLGCILFKSSSTKGESAKGEPAESERAEALAKLQLRRFVKGCTYLYLVIIAVQVLYSVEVYGIAKYFARKNFDWFVLYVPLGFIGLSYKLTRVFYLGALYLFMIAWGQFTLFPVEDAYTRIASGDSPFDREDVQCAGYLKDYAVKNGCGGVLFVPAFRYKHRKDDYHMGRIIVRINGFNGLSEFESMTQFEMPIDHYGHPFALGQFVTEHVNSKISIAELGLHENDCAFISEQISTEGAIVACPAYTKDRNQFRLVRASGTM